MKIIRSSTITAVPASHEDLRDPGVLKKVLFGTDLLGDGKCQMINWGILLPQKSFRSHYHEGMDEIFIILNGSVAITINDESATLSEGDAVCIPGRAVHTMKNLTDANVDYIVIGIVRTAGGKTIVV